MLQTPLPCARALSATLSRISREGAKLVVLLNMQLISHENWFSLTRFVLLIPSLYPPLESTP